MTLALSRPRTPSTGPRGFRTVSRYIDVWRQRRELARLSPAMLKDLGIQSNEALKEAARPFWDLPH